jgi:hypothetical protein
MSVTDVRSERTRCADIAALKLDKGASHREKEPDLSWFMIETLPSASMIIVPLTHQQVIN